jgi:ABC-type thiamin/hydroxymethylpyrimidine transport system permease subunit
MHINKSDKQKITIMNIVGYALAGISMAYFTYGHPQGSFKYYLSIIVFVYYELSALGGIWMFYTVNKYEKDPEFAKIVTILPYTFIWYYFEKYKKHKS